MQNKKIIKALRSFPLCLGQQTTAIIALRFKERCKSNTVTPQRLCELALSWRGEELLYYWKGEVKKVTCWMEKGNMREIHRGPQVALHWLGGNQAARGTQCLASMPCISHLPMLDPGAGTQVTTHKGGGAVRSRHEWGRKRADSQTNEMEKDTQEQDMPGLKPRDKQEWIVEKNERDVCQEGCSSPREPFAFKVF